MTNMTVQVEEHEALSGRAGARFAGVLLVVMLFALVGATPSDAQTTRPGDPAVAEAEFVRLLNQERAKAGRAPLVVHPNLTRDARNWSAVMAPQGTWVHTTDLAGETARSLPNWQRAGENVGYGWSVGSLHTKFVGSSTHYNNMIGDFNYVGIGVVYTSDRTYVTVRFAKAPVPTTTTVSATVAAEQVRRLYIAFFKREPDAGGSAFWVNKIVNGYPLGQISAEFIKSSEFVTTYGRLSDGQFITMVYQNVMGRTPDSGGYAYWVEKMQQGMGRGGIMTNFSESAEFKAKTA